MTVLKFFLETIQNGFPAVDKDAIIVRTKQNSWDLFRDVCETCCCFSPSVPFHIFILIPLPRRYTYA